jgi:hypothetical protein
MDFRSSEKFSTLSTREAIWQAYLANGATTAVGVAVGVSCRSNSHKGSDGGSLEHHGECRTNALTNCRLKTTGSVHGEYICARKLAHAVSQLQNARSNVQAQRKNNNNSITVDRQQQRLVSRQCVYS